jgi:PGF-pre-PGF domain-containing protein
MMRAILILVALMLLPAVNAASSLSASFGSYDTSVTKGSQFTVPITVTMPSGSNGTVDVTITPKTGLSCSECNQQLKFDTSGSKDVYFTISADIAGTYEEPFTMKATSTAATSTTATATSSVVVSEANNVEVICYNTSAPISVGTNEWHIPMKLEITTYGTAYTGVNVTLDPSTFTSNIQGIAVGPLSYYIGDVPAHSTLTFDWVLTATSFSVYGVSGNIMTDQGPLPDENGFSLDEDYEPPGGGGTPTGGGGPAEAKNVTVDATIENGKAVATFSKISAGTIGAMVIPDTADVAFKELAIKVKATVTNAEIVIYKLAEKPSSISEDITGVIQSYIQLDETNIEAADIDTVTIKFKVPASWVNDNKIDKAKVVLNRYADGKWTALTTTKDSEDSDNVHYSAVSPGLSTFGVSGQVQTVAPVTTAPPTTAAPVTTAPPTTVPPTVPLQITPPEQPKSNLGIVLAILAIVIIAGAAYYFYQKKGGEEGEVEAPEEVQEAVEEPAEEEPEEEKPAEEEQGAK